MVCEWDITVWGVRDSFPKVLKEGQIYGGNTTCIGVNCGETTIPPENRESTCAGTVGVKRVVMTHYSWKYTDDRPYKPGMPVEKALRILDEMANKENKLDPELTRLFIESECWKNIT